MLTPWHELLDLELFAAGNLRDTLQAYQLAKTRQWATGSLGHALRAELADGANYQAKTWFMWLKQSPQ